METFTQFDFDPHNTQYTNTLHEHIKIECSALDSVFRREFIQAVNKGALSRCETLLDSLDEGKCKRWLARRLLEMDFEAIRSFMQSA